MSLDVSTLREYLWTSFLPAFWPNLASTIVGVVIGVPVALWLTRYALRVQERTQRDDDSARLAAGLKAVMDALQFNNERLKVFAGQLEDKKASFDVGLDTSA